MDLKFLILFCYYNRPNMATYALESLRRQSYTNWELFFMDDGSQLPGKDVLNRFFPIDGKKIKYFHAPETIEDKVRLGGSVFGRYLNEAIQASDADICLILNDDDALNHEYLAELNKYYLANPDVAHSYCHVIEYNPFDYLDLEVLQDPNYKRNSVYNPTEPINAYCRVDSAQVSWRRLCNVNSNIWYPFPQTVALDAVLFQQLYNHYGFCYFNGLNGQLKGLYPLQLSYRHGQDQYSSTIDLERPKY